MTTRRTFLSTCIAFALSLFAGVPFIEKWLIRQQWKAEIREHFEQAIAEEKVVPYRVIDPLMCTPSSDATYRRRVYNMLRRRRKQN